MAHAQATEGIKNAIRAGVRSIEHGIYLDDEAISMMLQAGTWLVPTLVAPGAVLEAAKEGVRLPDGVAAKAEEVVGAHRESFARAIAPACTVAMGTDSGVGPHGAEPPRADLDGRGRHDPERGAGRDHQFGGAAARHAGRGGRDQPRRRADIVAVAGGPFELASLKAGIRAVYQGGRRVRG